MAPIDEIAAHAAYLEELLALGDPAMGQLVLDELPALEAGIARLSASPAAPDDVKPAFLTITAGSGGREAMDWARMLLRMYDKFLRRMGLEHECVFLDADAGGGIRAVTLRVLGAAYGTLRGEAGIYRLSRVSPFDQADRRQTSFASVEVTPEREAREDDVVVREEDCDVSTCRGGGAGGQKINKSECVVRVKHLPTGIIVRCQAGRGQAYNRKMAMKILASKLGRIADEQAILDSRLKRVNSSKAAFGNKYRRTFVLSQHPMVRDHVTGMSTIKIYEVLDGNLSELYNHCSCKDLHHASL